jgi:FAD/FMN-containing dehydrogenase
VIHNFGRNVAFEPAVILTPRSEAEVLEILARHRGRNIRVVGRLHSWSEAPRGDDVLLDLRHLNHVQTEVRGDGVWATVGAGCQIKRLLTELEQQANVTTPSLGLITEQAIAGAISTGTHGSGRHSLSHDMDEVRVAVYDAVTGEPVVRTITSGPELQAARCSLGCLGVILSVGFRGRPAYRVEEHFARYATLAEVLVAEESFPLQQFYLVPWLWQYYAQHRRETDAPRSRLAGLYRWYCFLNLDVGMHLGVIALSRWVQAGWLTRLFYRHLVPATVIRGWRVVDRSQHLLIMEHELFRHIETEIFVPRAHLAEALDFVQRALQHAGGDRDAFDASWQERLEQHGLWHELLALSGRHVHHYPICVRQVLPDDTLLSMASGGSEPWYAISLISYARPGDRAGFFAVAQALTDVLAALCDGRPHWGKHCPLTAPQAAALYPRRAEFQRVASEFDPAGQFRNRW